MAECYYCRWLNAILVENVVAIILGTCGWWLITCSGHVIKQKELYKPYEIEIGILFTSSVNV